MFSTPKNASNGKVNRLPRNPFHRMYVPQSAAHVVATENPDGTVTFSQFSLGETSYANIKPAVLSTPPREQKKSSGQLKGKKRKNSQTDTPGIEQATSTPGAMSLDAIRERFPLEVRSPNGSALKASRSVDIVIKDPALAGGIQKSVMLFFSPERPKETGKVHAPKKSERLGDVSSSESSELEASESSELDQSDSTSDTESSAKKRRLSKRLNSLLTELAVEDKENLPVQSLLSPDSQKGGKPVTLTYYYRARKSAKKESVVMGKTAKEELLSHLEENKHNYEPQTFSLLSNLAQNFAIEWLHRLAFSLCPKGINPQCPPNLGAGPKWINTYMMVLEGLADRFNKKHPDIAAIANPVFTVLPGSDVVDEIQYEVTLKKGARQVVTSSSIKALELPSAKNWPSTTDLPQLNCVIENMLNNSPPSFTRTLLALR